MKKLSIFVLLIALILLGTSVRAEGKQESSKLEDNDGDKIFDKLERELEGKRDSDKVKVVALFNLPAQQVDEEVGELKKSLGDFEIKDTYEVVPGFAATLTKKQVVELSKKAETLQIEPDVEVKAHLNTATQWFGIQKARSDFGVDGNADANPLTYSKDDIVVAVIDTGIDTRHKDLDQGKVIGWKDFVNNKTSPYDDNGHGTHVASIAAGEGEGNPSFIGVAPRAALVGVKVLNSRGSGTLSGVISGVNWAVTNKTTLGIEIINLSLGTSGCSSGTDSLSLAVNNAASQGVHVTVSAGNSGPATCTIGSPAAAAGAITVGAMADVGERGFYLASFSSRGPTLDGRVKPDVVAPGVAITGAKRGTTAGYTALSGTSMSSPFVAGTVALMLDKNPSLTTDLVKNTLSTTSSGWTNAGSDIDTGFGRLDGYEAIRNASSPASAGTNISVPAHTFISDDLPGTGAVDNWNINVTNAAYPVAVTLIMPTWSSVDFDLRIFNPAGTLIASSLGVTRQEVVAVTITSTGTYRIQVDSFSGSGPYLLDISAGGTQAVPDTTSPTAPTGLVVTATGSSQIDLSWNASTDNVGVTGYKVYRDNVLIAQVPATAYSNTGLTASTIYNYQVSAVDGAGNESLRSNTASATTLAPPPSALSVSVDAPNNIPQGDTFDVRATIGNTASTEATGVEATIVLPTGLSTPGSLTILVGSIPAGTSKEARWEVRADSQGTFTVTANVSDASGGTTQGSVSVVASSESD